MTILRDISIAWSLFNILLLFIILFESRYPRKKTILVTGLTMGPLILLNLVLFVVLGPAQTAQMVLLTCTLPSLVVFYILAKRRDGRFFFTFCLADTVSYWFILVTMILDHYLGGGQYILMFILRLLIFPLAEWAIWRYFRKSYLLLQETIEKGWGAFTAVAAVFYVLLLALSSYPVLITERPDDMLAAVLILVLMPLTYMVIFMVLYHQHQLYRTREEDRILRMQTAMLTQQAAHYRELEDNLRIQRHDLRHHLKTAASLMEQDRKAEALDYLSSAERELESIKADRWCSNPILNAVFSAYFRQAKAAGVTVEAELSLPEELPLDEGELSTVFANALENALQACATLPEGRRRIRCKCISSPQFMFQITNTYAGEVVFDENGRPVTDKSGHGIGTRSIAAFCEKHGAHWEYKAENGLFSLRILLM